MGLKLVIENQKVEYAAFTQVLTWRTRFLARRGTGINSKESNLHFIPTKGKRYKGNGAIILREVWWVKGMVLSFGRVAQEGKGKRSQLVDPCITELNARESV